MQLGRNYRVGPHGPELRLYPSYTWRRPRDVTFWLYFPYQGFRSGYRCFRGALTGRGPRSVHGRCARLPRGVAPIFLPAAAGRAGPKLAYGPSTGSVRTAGCGPGTLVPGRRRRRTRQHVPSGHGRRGSASIRPAGPAPGTRAESADTKLTARPAARGATPWHGGLVRPFPDNFPPAPVRFRGPRRSLACAGTGTVHARKGETHHDLPCQPVFGPATAPDTIPVRWADAQTCQRACRPS
jgi:hypothetical protein